jgi:hypothetical protein
MGTSQSIKSIIKVQSCIRRWRAIRALEAAKKEFIVRNIGRKYYYKIISEELRRPTSKGLDTGAPMFSQAEIDRIINDKSVRRFMVFHNQETKEGAGSEALQVIK